MAAAGGKLYIIENERLHQVNPTSGKYKVLGEAVWKKPPIAMAAVEEKLYVVENHTLHRVNPSNGRFKTLGKDIWRYEPIAVPGSPAGNITGLRTIESVEDLDGDGKPDRVIYTRDDAFVFLSTGQSYRLKGSPFANDDRCDPTPNGCSWAPDFNFKEVCDDHDRDYAEGGNEADRKAADEKLRSGIQEKGHPILAELYYAGVRAFGRNSFCYKESSETRDGGQRRERDDDIDESPGGPVYEGDVNDDEEVSRTA